jgi:Ser-tRNA(Ala) deacylase AlaX
VLVVDRVELVLLDQAQEVRHLDRHHTLRLLHRAEAGDEVVEVRHVRHHVVGGDQVGEPVVVEIDWTPRTPRLCAIC